MSSSGGSCGSLICSYSTHVGYAINSSSHMFLLKCTLISPLLSLNLHKIFKLTHLAADFSFFYSFGLYYIHIKSTQMHCPFFKENEEVILVRALHVLLFFFEYSYFDKFSLYLSSVFCL